jgi:long-subunit acyl-CoA synthetase (AMP-forming)
MLGYYGEEEKSSKVIDENGWFHSGDRAMSDENG